MNKPITCSIYILSALVLMNTAQQDSTASKEKPQVNFKGILVDSSSKQSLAVENITISKLYKNIPFFTVPTKPEAKPEDNTTLIDLAKIESIKAVPYEEQKTLFNGRQYIKINIALEDKTADDYLVEASRKIYCDISSSKIEKVLSFDAISQLTITSHKNRDNTSEEIADAKPKASVGHERECAQAGKALQMLDEEVQKVSGSQKYVIAELVDSVKNWVGSICSTSKE